MLGQEQKRVYLNIAEGKVVRRTDRGTEKFDFVSGDLERIYSKEREFRGEKVPYWYLDLRDTQTGDLYTLGINATSGVWRGIIFCLGSEEFNPLLPLKISPYVSGDYSRVSVYSGDKRLEWVSGIPPVEEVEVDGRRVRSVAKREELISGLVERINESLGQTPPPTAQTPPPPSRRPRRGGGYGLSLSGLMGDQ